LPTMPLGHGSANPAKNGCAAGDPDDPGALVCACGHGFRWPTVCEGYKEDRVSEVRVPDNVHGIPSGPFGARTRDVNGGSDASPPAFHGPTGSTSD
ncbi:hypothetical protein T07_3901, partial [Trichinella nelsoni]